MSPYLAIQKSLVVAVSWLAIAGCSASGGPINRGRAVDALVATGPPRGLRDLGGRGHILHQSVGLGVARLPRLEERLNEILVTLLRKSPWPDTPTHAYVHTDATFNAVSHGDGTILVNLGLLTQVESEDEVAAALAHELAHVLLQHHQSDWFAAGQRKTIRAGRFGVAYGLPIAMSAARSVAEKFGGYAVAGWVVANELANLTTRYILSSFSRRQEQEADFLGFDLLVSAGYNGRAYNQLLQRFDSLEQVEAAEQRAKWEAEVAKARSSGRSRPTPRARAQREAIVANDPLSSALGSVTAKLNQALDRGRQGLDKGIEESVVRSREKLAAVGSDHPRASDRLIAMREYIRTNYATLPPVDMRTESWKAILAEPDTSKLLAQHAAARQALEALERNDRRTAWTLASRAVETPGGDHALPRWTMYRVRQARGESRDARRDIEVAMSQPDPPLTIMLAHADILLEENRPEEALGVLDRIQAQYLDPPVAFPSYIRAYKGLDRGTDALKTKMKCDLAGSEELVVDCAEALGEKKATGKTGRRASSPRTPASPGSV